MRFIVFIALLAVFAAPAPAQDFVLEENGHEFSSDLSRLPEAVRKRREELLAIADKGDISALTPILEADKTTVSFGDPEDPTAYLMQQSGDGKGYETLATLADLLEMPYAAQETADGSIVYVWPYLAVIDTGFADMPPDQLVDAYQLLGYAGFEETRGLDAWYSWRVYIDADGTLSAFVAGD